MIERMQAMMQAAEQAAPRIVTADEAIAEELRKRHGERALLIEARRGADGRLRVLAVLDLDADGLAAEARRAAERNDASAPAVEVIDRATWLAMRRLETTGMLKLAEGSIRILHRSAELAGDAGASDQAARAADLQREAERSLRMAKLLAGGGFAEEAPVLIAKTLGCLGAAKLATLGELPPGATTATPQQLRDLVDRGALPPRTATTLAGLWPAAGAPSGSEIVELIGATERVIADYLAGDTSSVSAAA
jgi:hypothetical protein